MFLSNQKFPLQNSMIMDGMRASKPARWRRRGSGTCPPPPEKKKEMHTSQINFIRMWEKRRRTRLLRRPHLPGPHGCKDEPGLGVDRLAVLAQEGVDGGRSVAAGPGAAVPRGGPRQQPGIAGQEDDGVVAGPLLQGQAERHRGVQDLLLPLAEVLLLPSPNREGGRRGGWTGRRSRTVRAKRLE